MPPILRSAAFVLLASLSLAAPAADHKPATVGDAEFVRLAALSDMFETRSSELAAIKGDEATRAFAAKMNEAHQKTSSELGVLVKGRAADLPLPARLDAARQRSIDRLAELEGEAFKRQYLDDQVGAHEAAVRLFSAVASTGAETGLRAWAAKTLPALREHLAMARSLR